MEQKDYCSSLAIECRFMRDLEFGDSRLSERLNLALDRIEKDPTMSFPMLFSREKELDAFYRFVNNERITPEPFIRAFTSNAAHKVSQLKSSETVLAIHDTSQFEFASLSQLKGAGRLTGNKKGFLGHFCLAAKMDHEVLGILDLKTWSRTDKIKGKRNRIQIQEDPASESKRWRDTVENVHCLTDGNKNIVHVMDREADDYNLFSLMMTANMLLFGSNMIEKSRGILR